MFYNITRAVTIAINALRNAVVWSNQPTIRKKVKGVLTLRTMFDYLT